MKTAWLRIMAPYLLIVFFFAAGCASQETVGLKKSGGSERGTEGTESLYPGESDSSEEVNGIIEALVTSVTDGDTIRVTLKDGREEKLRLIGVDTPESTRETEPFGKEASAYTKKRLENSKVWLELDTGERDRYGRLLAYVWMEQPAEPDAGDSGIRRGMFNAELLLEGYAQVMTVPPNVRYVDYFSVYQREAREQAKGLWSKAINNRSGQVEEYYTANSRSKKFHRPDCRSGKQISPSNLMRFKTMEEALDAGFQPCQSCKP